MATIKELQANLAEIEKELVPLRAELQSAKIKTNEAQAALDAYYNTPGNISLAKKVAAQNAVAADPTNVQLQQNLKQINEQWSSQQAQLQPLLAARDAAFAEQVKAEAAVVVKDNKAADIEIEIAKTDPSQATPEAIAYLTEQGKLPITPAADPALPEPQPQPSPIYSTPADTNVEPAAVTASVTPLKVTANPIVDDDFGNPLVLGQTPKVVEPQKTADAYPNEFAGVDEAIALQEKIAINTSGLPVRAEDGSVASGVAINPETGETYYTVPTGSSKGLQGARTNTQAQSTAQDQANFALKQDWRVRLSLAPNSGYLYNALNTQGILQPLINTNGVVFPYTPSIQIQYNAHYDNYDLTHSNYKIYQYKNSSVDTIQISCDFTAQDTAEANYLLAVIHFFKSVTKMFYGQDSIPKIGTPPPLCFLSGLGSFQFDNHPLVITSFAYNLPTDVDYIRASASATTSAGENKSPAQPPNNTNSISNARLSSSGTPIATGGVTPATVFGQQTLIQTPSASSRTPTYVPTKMNLSISANPIVTRNDISNRFSLRDYATGKLLQGSKNATVGIW
jgi:hypothetical protein